MFPQSCLLQVVWALQDYKRHIRQSKVLISHPLSVPPVDSPNPRVLR